MLYCIQPQLISPRKAIFDRSSSLEVRNVILKGARSIELDIFTKNITRDGKKEKIPIVSHGTFVKNFRLLGTTCISFEECCKEIKEYAWLGENDYPIFLKLQLNHRDKETAEKIAQILVEYFDQQIFKAASIKELADTQMGKLESAIVIMAGYGINGSLKKIVTKWDDTFRNIPSKRFPEETQLKEHNKNFLSRIYPSNIISSKNYDPIPAMKKGCQFVSLNYQKEDNYFRSYYFLFSSEPIFKKSLLQIGQFDA